MKQFVGLPLGISAFVLLFSAAAWGDEISVTPRQLVVGLTCSEVDEALKADNFNKLDATEAEEVILQKEKCRVEARNKAKPDDQEIMVIAAGQRPDKANSKIFFATLKPSDVRNIENTCRLLAKQTSNVINTLGGVPTVGQASAQVLMVATDGGKVQCDALLSGLKDDNPFVVLAPSLITGAAISTRILAMMGENKTAREVQAAVDNLGREAGNAIKVGAREVKKHPILLLPGTGGDVVRLAHITKRVLKKNPIPEKPLDSLKDRFNKAFDTKL